MNILKSILVVSLGIAVVDHVKKEVDRQRIEKIRRKSQFMNKVRHDYERFHDNDDIQFRE